MNILLDLQDFGYNQCDWFHVPHHIERIGDLFPFLHAQYGNIGNIGQLTYKGGRLPLTGSIHLLREGMEVRVCKEDQAMSQEDHGRSLEDYSRNPVLGASATVPPSMSQEDHGRIRTRESSRTLEGYSRNPVLGASATVTPSMSQEDQEDVYDLTYTVSSFASSMSMDSDSASDSDEDSRKQVPPPGFTVRRGPKEICHLIFLKFDLNGILVL